MSSEEKVNHPKHYGGADNPYEAIKVIEAWELGFHLGNTVKYISRAGKKDGEAVLDDLDKAAWYLNRMIDNIRGVKLTDRAPARSLWVIVDKKTGQVVPEFEGPFDGETSAEAAWKAHETIRPWNYDWMCVPATEELLAQFPQAE